jgi:hypothetical protein
MSLAEWSLFGSEVWNYSLKVMPRIYLENKLNFQSSDILFSHFIVTSINHKSMKSSYVKGLSSYPAVNTFCLGYKNQPVNIV